LSAPKAGTAPGSDLAVEFPDGSVAPMAGSHFAATFYSGSLEGEAR
jgi:hypothetical protein